MKQKIIKGVGLFKMLDICKKYGLNQLNSRLEVEDQSNLNSRWRIVIVEHKK